jgi:outer membrane protein assembly factor BamB
MKAATIALWGRAVALSLDAPQSRPGTPAMEWPQWRGPSRNGVVPAAHVPKSWPKSLTKGWSTEVGEGYSSPVTADGKVFVHARRDPDETVTAVDLATGRVAWQQKYTAPFNKNPYAKEMAKGPYATPLYLDGRLFTLGSSAILSAWNASTGAPVWQKDYSTTVDTAKLFCGTAVSPIRTSAGIVVFVGDDRAGVIRAVDPDTGQDRWTTTLEGPGYASPVEIVVQGTPQLVAMTTKSVVGVAPQSGARLWEFPFPDEWNENIVTPVAVADGVIVSGVRQGTRLLKISRESKNWSAREAWHTGDVTMYMSSPVLADGLLFGHSTKRRGQFVALDPASGKIRWSTEGREGATASVLAAGSRLLFLTSESELVVARLTGDAFQQEQRYTVASSPTYAHPIVLGDRLVVRDATHVTLWTLR